MSYLYKSGSKAIQYSKANRFAESRKESAKETDLIQEHEQYSYDPYPLESNCDTEEITELKNQLDKKNKVIKNLREQEQYTYDPYPLKPILSKKDITEDLLRKIDTLVDDLRQKDTLVKQLMKSQGEERNKQFSERERTDTIIMKLTRDLEDYRKAALHLEDKITVLVDDKIKNKGVEFRKCFEQPKTENKEQKHSKVVTLFSDRSENHEKDLERLRKMMTFDPLAGKNFLQRVFIRLFKPELLRKAN